MKLGNCFKICAIISFVAFLQVLVAVNLGKCQPPGGYLGEPNQNTRESGLSGFEHKSRQFEVGAGGDLTYTIPLLTLPGQIPLDIELTYTSGIKVDQSASWVGLGWSLGEYGVRRITVSGDDGVVSEGFNPIQLAVKVNDVYEVIIPGRSIKFINYGDERNPQFAPMNYTADSLFCKTFQRRPDFSEPWRPTDESLFVLITPEGTRYIFDDTLKRAGIDWDVTALVSWDNGVRHMVNNTWLLTAILSSDYVDGSNPPDNNPLNSVNSNKGYWISFRYSWDNQTEGNKKRAHFGSWAGPASIGSNYNDTTDLTNLHRIVTPTHVLQFKTSERVGHYQWCLRSGVPSGGSFCNNVCDNSCNPQPPHYRVKFRKLDALRLFKYSGNGSEPTGDLLTEFRFSYKSDNLFPSPQWYGYSDLKMWGLPADYNEQPLTGGELTLWMVAQTGADSFLVGSDGARHFPHPYVFDYAYNPILYDASQSSENYDWWFKGFTNYRPNNPGDWSVPIYWLRDFFGYYDYTDTQTIEQTAWQLTDVTLPTGGKIRYEWETDSYKYTDSDYALPNTFDFPNNGGTRIKRIITYKEYLNLPNHPADTVLYTYGENGDGWGYPNSMPPTYLKWKKQFQPCPDPMWIFNSDNVNHMIYYPLITEEYRSRGSKGKKETYYRISKNGPMDMIRDTTWLAYPNQVCCVPYDSTCFLTWLDHTINIFWDRSILLGMPDSVVLKDKVGNIISKEKKYYSFISKFADISTLAKNHVPEWVGDTLASSYHIRLDSTVTVKDGVKYKTAFEYDPLNQLPNKITEYGNGKNKVTTYQYAYSINSAMRNKYMLTQLYTTKIFEEIGPNQYLRAQSKTNWADFDSDPSLDRWYPSAALSWKDLDSDLVVDTGEEIQVQSFENYDSYGNLTQWSDANGIKSITKYGRNLESIVEASNATGATVFYNDFEHGATYDAWLSNNGTLNSDQVFSGDSSLKVIYNGSETKGASHIVSDANTYLFTAWVKCDVVGRAKIVLKNLSDQTTVQVTNQSANKWELLKITKTISAGQQLEAYVAVAGGTATAYFDELRLSPDNALVTTKVYDETHNLIASSDENSLTKHYVYDAQQRLIVETDETGSPISGRAYGYSVNWLSCYNNNSHPGCTWDEWISNSLLEVKATAKGYLDDFSSNSLGNYTQSGALYDTGKRRVKLPYGTFIKLPFNFSNVAVSFDFVKTTPFNPVVNGCPANPGNGWDCCDTAGILEIFLHSTSAGDYYKCMLQKNVVGTPKIRLTSSSNPGVTLSDFGFSITTPGIGSYQPNVMYNFFMIRLNQHIYIFINGHLAIYVSDSQFELQNFNAVEIASHCDTFYLDNFIVYNKPTLTRYLYDGLGNMYQTLKDNGKAFMPAKLSLICLTDQPWLRKNESIL